ncbi:ligase-associated DNA damage response DEXH box helicase [Rivibacter subsaxonicus]|uniref:ATP-dependent Lhr-like helicase n=1 Tax=Rivibacter subsaxonicus TaxID=457575 RepID=A0A4Q7VGY4_9BURK|nr:ligase-associated DNA damage response DEXH box helicase [Rivibacter subsaxonicus]RZT95284.1 ATP-dependent Lhr-like helicase [Rivibacter subsaxonicus]
MRDPSTTASPSDAAPLQAARAWFSARGWQPAAFQVEAWQHMLAGRSGLLHASTGSGKTYAVWFGALLRVLVEKKKREQGAPPLRVLWITPMRALAADSLRAITLPLADLAPHWTAGIRTGDTPSAERARQDRRMPTVLVTTPESLSLMLSREHAREELAQLDVVIVDEWHELMGNKRGVQAQLALARLRTWNPALLVWGLSATLGNLDEAARTLHGHAEGALVRGHVDKTLVIDTLLPANPGRFSWAGHLGAQMLEPLVAELEASGTALVFTNTRSQAEIWYQLIINARPDWAGLVALHHGSLAHEVREWVEAGLKAGKLKAVVATSSLDLGVDFLPVERVLQIGSAKGVARLLQRAGRSGHQPGRPSRITLVPTNTLELVEAAAARRAAQAGRIERRETPQRPLDVLVQHLVTLALGGGFEVLPRDGAQGGHDAPALLDEIRRAHAYRDLTLEQFRWALDFVERGGASLGAYPEYHRVRIEADADGVLRAGVPDRGIARRHRMSVGTIVSDASMQVKWITGGTIGSIDEGFIARLKPGDCFIFAGRVLEYVRTREMAAYVKRAARNRGAVPVWGGGKMPLSTEMASAVLDLLQGAAQGDDDPVWSEPELQAARPMLQTQVQLSRLPTPRTLLVETCDSREGHHLCLYPFGGRNVHIGLAQLFAWRLSKHQPNTFSLAVNDYGLELLSALPIELGAVLDHSLFDSSRLLDDVLQSLNSGELAQRRFREIARVAGLVFTGFPGAPKSTRQLQASSSLFYEVFRKYDAGNLLLTQADAEVLSQELEIGRLAATLARMQTLRIEHVALPMPSPMSLPLMVERLREKLTTEKLADRLQRMLQELEAGAARAETSLSRPAAAGAASRRRARGAGPAAGAGSRSRAARP